MTDAEALTLVVALIAVLVSLFAINEQRKQAEAQGELHRRQLHLEEKAVDYTRRDFEARVHRLIGQVAWVSRSAAQRAAYVEVILRKGPLIGSPVGHWAALVQQNLAEWRPALAEAIRECPDAPAGVLARIHMGQMLLEASDQFLLIIVSGNGDEAALRTNLQRAGEQLSNAATTLRSAGLHLTDAGIARTVFDAYDRALDEAATDLLPGGTAGLQ